LAKSASNLDLVASLENRVSGGANATQTIATKQSRAHVPVGDGHLYLPAVSGNYASVPDADNLDGFGDFAMEFVGSSEDWHAGLALSLIGKWTSSGGYFVRLQANGTLFFLYNTSGGQNYHYSTASHNLVDGEKGGIRVIRDGSSIKFYENLYAGNGWQQIGSPVSGSATTLVNGSQPLEVGTYNGGTAYPFNGSVISSKVWNSASPDTASPVLDIDFSDGDHKASSFTCSTGQTVTINTSGNDPATIVRKSFMRMDLVDDEYEFTTGSAVNGTIVVATLEGTYSANISLDASTQYDLQARGVASLASVGFLKNPVGYLVSSSPLSESEISSMEDYFVDKGAAPRSDFGSVTDFAEAWYNCSSLTSFPAINTSSGTDFYRTWRGCNSLTSFPLINTSSGTSFSNAWRDCDSLTSFPLIDTSSGTNFFAAWYGCSSLTTFPLIDTSSGANFSNAWNGCSSLTSFPLIDTSSGTNFSSTWYGCSSLTSFPAINTSSGTDFYRAWRNCTSLTSFSLINPESALRFRESWYGCTSLTTFPANFFDNWSPPSLYSKTFDNAWYNCTSLTAQSVENILTSIDTSGIYGTTSGASGGTQLADNTIDIDYDGSTLSSATTTAITSLKSKNWAININNVIQ